MNQRDWIKTAIRWSKAEIERFLSLRRAITLVWKSGPRWSLASGILILANGALPVLMLLLVKQFIDAIDAGLDSGQITEGLGNAGYVLLLAAGVGLLQSLASAAGRFVEEAQSQEVGDYVFGLLHAKSIEVDLAYYENSDYHDSLHRAQHEARVRTSRVVRGVLRFLQSLATLLGITVLLAAYHWAIVPVLILISLPGAFLRIKYAGDMHKWQRSSTSTERQSRYLNDLLTRQRFAKELRLLRLGDLFREQFQKVRNGLRVQRRRHVARRALAEFLGEALAIGGVFGVLAWLATQTIGGAVTVGTLVMIFQALNRAQTQLGQMLRTLSSLYEDNLFLVELYRFLDMKPDLKSPENPKPFPRSIEEGIRLEHVSFTYPGCDKAVLHDLNLFIPPGRLVAFVGRNGSGKTTFLKLLCRLYDPTEGRITVDGIDLREFDLDQIRRHIAILPQDYGTFFRSARDNIWYGDVDAPPDSERIVEAARRSGADEYLSRMPGGYDTMLGTMFEGGQELSIGQWQKLALARSYYREAPILALDEPTSGMDPISERSALEPVLTLDPGKVAILISHRLSAVTSCESIHVLEHGKIIESGRHDELLIHGAAYAELYEAQASNTSDAT